MTSSVDLNGSAPVQGEQPAARNDNAATSDDRNTSRPDADPRPCIQIRGGHLDQETNAVERALLEAGEPLYQRAGQLVRVVAEETEASHGRRVSAHRFIPVVAPYVRDRLCSIVRFQSYDGRKKNWKDINAPLDHCVTLLARTGLWKFPTVVGIANAPIVRRDGSVFCRDGYDPVTRMILVDSPVMPAGIDGAVSRGDALAALALLKSLLVEFPLDDVSRAVALSAILSAVNRGAFTAVPLHLARASTAGSGKSYLWDTVAAIATGKVCPVITAADSPEETEKRLGAALLASRPLISLDNLSNDLAGDALAQIIERPSVDIRVLGRSQLYTIENRALLLATGNNVRIAGDLVRRVLVATLDPQLERPELRQFRSNPVATVLQDRARYVAAAVAVVRAYIVARQPQRPPRLASFEGWSDTVRGALMWLGEPDPVTAMERARDSDPVLQNLAAVIGGLEGAGVSEGNPMTAAGLVALVMRPHGSSWLDTPIPEGLKDALVNAAGRRGVVEPVGLGRWLGRNERRICNGRQIRSAKTRTGALEWWVEQVPANARAG